MALLRQNSRDFYVLDNSIRMVFARTNYVITWSLFTSKVPFNVRSATCPQTNWRQTKWRFTSTGSFCYTHSSKIGRLLFRRLKCAELLKWPSFFWIVTTNIVISAHLEYLTPEREFGGGFSEFDDDFDRYVAGRFYWDELLQHFYQRTISIMRKARKNFKIFTMNKRLATQWNILLIESIM